MNPRPFHRGLGARLSPLWLRAILATLPPCTTVATLGMAHAATADAQTPQTAALPQAEAALRSVEQGAVRQATAEQTQRTREAEAAALSAEIERLKSQPEGVARDLALNGKLAQAQASAVVLQREGTSLRAGASELQKARQRLLAACDRLLNDGGDGSLSSGQRLHWLRVRTAQVEALLQPVEGATLPAPRVAVGGTAQGEPSSDDPQTLREQADLLRDSVDKVRREIERLTQRSDELARRQRLRERASRVDEDLFAEQATARRAASRANAARNGAEAAPAADAVSTGGPGVTSPPPFAATPTPARSGPDPSTLDALMRVDGGGDATAKQQALSRARGELETLAADLLRRAARLEQRATELGRQK